MTMERDRVAELFGLAGTFPRPGWVVLDAARDHRFTGELVFETVPEVRVYLDRGQIYLAERVTDPSLGSRLVDAGALNAAQLEHGAMRLGDAEHLGRLFERVPSVDRHAVLVTAELMTEECVGWLAGQQIRAVVSTPYRHHASGVHRWERPADCHDLSPGDPLPAPAPDDQPLEIAPPEPLFEPTTGIEPFDDDMIRWDEPSWLDARSRRAADHGATPTAPAPEPSDSPAAPADDTTAPSEPGTPAGPLSIRTDWIDRLPTEGLPEPGADPLAPTTKLRPVQVEPMDRFEVIWPSGEIDDQFGGADIVPVDDHHPDHDRAGPTARLARGSRPIGDVDATTDGGADEGGPFDEPEGPSGSGVAVGTTDEVVLAVRRAVASIETGSLAARRRLVEHPGDQDTSRGHELVPPGRVAVRDEPREWSPGRATGHRTAGAPIRSVFDDDAVEPESDAESTEPPARAEADDARTGALRRLIGSLRRR